MRDPNRIDVILATLKEAWLTEPDLRLGQLVTIASRPKSPCPDVFYCEDDALLEGLKNYMRIRSGVADV